jgi:hypothetical protein
MDLFYAAAALEAWAPESFAGSIEGMAKDAYYNDLDDTSDGEPDASPCIFSDPGAHTLPARGSRTPIPDARKQRLYDRNKALKGTKFSSMMDGVMALWKRPTVGRQGQEILGETTTTLELEHSRKKVQAWMDEGLNSGAALGTSER